MGRSLLTVLAILMLGMVISIFYFTSTRAEAVTPTPTNTSILSATGEALGASCNAAQAYAFLKSRASGNANIQPRLSGSGAQGGIDPELACRLQRFLQAYPNMRITSAYRSQSYQRTLCRQICGADSCPGKCAPAGRSCHQYGLAVDVNNNSTTMRQAARSYKLHYPYSKGHVQCIEHRTAGRSTCNSPCAKGGVQINGGDTASTLLGSFSNPYSPSSNSPGGTPDISSLLSNLGGSPGGTSPSSSNSSAIFTSLPELEAALLEAGDIDGEEFIGDGPPAFDELLGEFGEFGEGDEVRAVLGYNDNSNRASTTERFDGTSVPKRNNSNASSSTSSSGNDCASGVTTRNIYGNIICVRDSVTTVTESNGAEQNADSGNIGIFFDSIPGGGPIKQTLSTLVGGIVPIRYLLDGNTNNSSQGDGYVFDTDRSLSAYDAYRPREAVAYGAEFRTPLQEEDIIAWMIQNDIVAEEDLAQQAFVSALLGLLRPIVMHLALVLFGTGSYGAEALLDLANNI